MNQTLVRRTNHLNFSESARGVTVSCTRPLLDVQVGAALWKDRRVAVSTKVWSLTAGLLMMGCMVAMDYVLARWTFGVRAIDPLSVSSVALVGGSLLFSTIALLRLAPAKVVNVLRLRRCGVIPLRTKRQ
jgi:hypothetical protein